MEPDETFGRCWGCGYDLRGSAGRVCPECGREFDPQDPRTRDRGVRSLGRLGRFLVKPVGSWALVAVALATLGLVVITGWPEGGGFSLLELRYYFWPSNVRPADYAQEVIAGRWATWTGAVTAAAIVLCTLAGGWAALRTSIRGLLIWRRQVPPGDRPSGWTRPILTLLFLVVAVAWLGFGWINRLAGHFAERQLALKPDAREAARRGILSEPVIVQWLLPELSIIQRDRILEHRGTWHWSARKRTASLALLIGNQSATAIPTVRRRLALESDREVRLTMMRALIVTIDVADLDLWTRLLDSTDAEERALGADGISHLRGAPGVKRTGGWGWEAMQDILASDPPIDLRSIARRGTVIHESGVAWPRERLWNMATEGATAREREAARRALVMLPGNDYRLRIAEWGVWLANGSEMELARKELEGIPPFVHRVGDSVASMKDRMHLPAEATSVFKPIIHVTTDRRMCLDISVAIARGRPWFVYPRPDDFAFQANTDMFRPRFPVPRKLSLLDPPGLKPLEDLRSGMPWMFPGRAASAIGIDPEELENWGVRWESLLVTQQLEAGMKLAEVPKESKFAWWQGLRDVPAYYVTNRGETERFLYYDGPTLMGVPRRFRLDGTKLHVTKYAEPWRSPAPDTGVYIEVKRGRSRAAPVRLDSEQVVELPPLEEDARGVLAKLLFPMNLTEQEEKGLLDSWDEQFFRTDGKRFLLLMPTQTYNDLCPIHVTPEPTEQVRIGIVWTEL